MYRVLTCLTDQHDYRLVLLAIVICALATFTAFYIYRSARQTEGYRRLGWILLAGVATGAGIWATHFVAMLAFKTGLPTAYDPALTAASLLIAIVVTAAGLLIAVQGKSRLYPALGGAVIGLGIADMHYTGMRAFSTMGTVSWDGPLVTASVVLGVVFSAAALLKYHESQRLAVVSAAGLLTVAICLLHFTAMGAAIITPDPTVRVYPSLVDNSTMAMAVAGVSSLVVLAALGAALIDRESARETAARLRELADAAAEGIVIARDGIILNVNKRVVELSGRSQEELLGSALFGNLLVGEMADNNRFETVMLTASGQSLAVEVIRRPYPSDMRANEVYALRDLQERRKAEDRIRELSHYDTLTGLANRATLRVRLDDILKKAKAQDLQFAVASIDLRDFREINDRHGHDEGDRILSISADRMLRAIKSDEFLGRMGGDEFVVIQDVGEQPDAAAMLGNRLIEALATPLDVSEETDGIHASIGIALYPQDGDSAEQLLANADIALYRAKQEDQSAVCFFEPEMDMAVRHRRRLAQDLRLAVGQQQLEIYYQAQAKVQTGALVGFEALVRWNHPEHGLIPPDDFIPIAEESGLIVPIGEWALRTACVEAATWPKPYRVGVNLSARQFRATDFSSLVHQVLLETGLSPARLELEITETALFEDLQRAVDTLRRLRALGISVAMDDFGTGYSSLSSLQAFPFSKIKIARELVEHLGTRGQAAVIVKSVLALGKSLEIPVLAEGVENIRQLEFLRSLDCQEAQGYYLGRPARASELVALLESGFVHDPTLAKEAGASGVALGSNVTPITRARRRPQRRPVSAG